MPVDSVSSDFSSLAVSVVSDVPAGDGYSCSIRSIVSIPNAVLLATAGMIPCSGVSMTLPIVAGAISASTCVNGWFTGCYLCKIQ